MGPAGALDLVDAVSGRPLAPLVAGKVVLVSFIDSTCRESCPVVEAKFAAVQAKLERDGYLGSRVQLVLSGIDPVVDTLPRLAAKAHALHARSDGFHLAGGSANTLDPVLRAYGIDVTFHGASREDPDHPVEILLIDPAMRIRYDFAMFYTPQVMARISEQLADETVKCD